jgi:uncharacterized protein YceH (UPF0502 family)
MELSVAEGRVLGCLIEKQVTEADDSYSLTLDELRFACNQTSQRDPVVAFDDRTVEDTLLSLKAMGLARFVTVGHRARPLSYRQRADERWRLGRPELAVLATLLLRGPQTVEQIWKLLDEQSVAVESSTDVEVALDTLAGRTPTPLAARLALSDGPEGVSWVEVLTGRYTLDQPPPDDYEPRPPMPSRRGSGLPAREPWRPDERFDSRGRREQRDPRERRDAREQDDRRPPDRRDRHDQGDPRDMRDPREPQGQLDLDRSPPQDQRGPHDRRPEPPHTNGVPNGVREPRAPRPVDLPTPAGPPVPVAVPAEQAGRPAPTLSELADRLTGIERRLAAIEAALADLRSGGGPPPPPPQQPQQSPQGRQQGQQGQRPPGPPPQPPRQQGQPSRPAPSRPHR